MVSVLLTVAVIAALCGVASLIFTDLLGLPFLLEPEIFGAIFVICILIVLIRFVLYIFSCGDM